MRKREHRTSGGPCWCYPDIVPNEDASGVVFVHHDLRFVGPFPRLRFRLRHGFWCEHPRWSAWKRIDTGMRQIRWCEGCDYAQIR